jgi:squalene-hopene/tetraprenyl-beta-curcumene cyclase
MTMRRAILVAWSLILAIGCPVPGPAGEMLDRGLAVQAFKHSDYGLRYLRERQAKDGSWSGSVHVTALALRAFLESYREYDESDGAFITRPVGFLLRHVGADGSISDGTGDRVRDTAAALAAFKVTGNPEHRAVIDNARAFLASMQLDDDDGVSRKDPRFGGIGEGNGRVPTLVEQYLVLEALGREGAGPGGGLRAEALVFLERLQNLDATNDQRWAGDDGGFILSPAAALEGNTASSASMTHSGLAGLLYAGADKRDPRVVAASGWIAANYTLEPDGAALPSPFYFYDAFVTSLRALGQDTITAPDGSRHNWRNDLLERLLGLYNPDGSWGESGSEDASGGAGEEATARSVIVLNKVIRSLRGSRSE